MTNYYAVGDYVLGRKIGAGSFSTVWHGRHRVDGKEVAIKEIAAARLNPKLQESLKSEVFILKRINHPNIIRLYDVIEEGRNIYLVLEFCEEGDLSMYIQRRRGIISKETTKHFLQQLAEGLKVLRENNIIHRDLKPQNLLISTVDDKSTLKIADFGFARSLQPRDVAETLCGSPLYMAPEIMRYQKYDAKADLWSVGTILFQLVTGKTPFTGSNPMQLLKNIMESTELRFPPQAKDLNPHCLDLCQKLLRRNPVERLAFEEFFNHPYLSNKQHCDCLDDSPLSGRNTEETSRENSSASTYGLSLDSESEQKDYLNLANITGSVKYSSSLLKTNITGSNLGSRQLSEGNLKETELGKLDNHKKVVDSLESIIRDYVIVSVPSVNSYPKQEIIPSKTDDPPLVSHEMNDKTGNLGSHISTSRIQGSTDVKQPLSDCITRANSLQCYASSIRELVNEKAERGKHLEAFSVELVVLAIWKQALDIYSEVSNTQHSLEICSQIERALLHEVENAEELSKVIEPGNTEMPDAMELIYQSALAFGKRGAVDEYMGNNTNAVAFYSKAARLLQFLVGEATRLTLNPPFSLTSSSRYRIRIYIETLTKRQSILESQEIAPSKVSEKGRSCPS